MFNSKPDGYQRFCVDYRKLNNVSVRNVYPIFRIYEWFDFSGDALIFSILEAIAAINNSRSTMQVTKNLFHFTSLAVQVFKNAIWIAQCARYILTSNGCGVIADKMATCPTVPL